MTSVFDSMIVTRLDSTDGLWRVFDENTRLTRGDLIPGSRLRIEAWLGEGGMGQVYEAVHLDLGRRVAVKVMRSTGEDSSQLAESFLAEARACAKVTSRFVVEVLDFGELPDRRPYFVMELLEGETVHQALPLGGAELERAIPILRQCCKALAAIHAAGLVHRDIKPKNIVLQTEDGRRDTVRIVDFGLAASLGSRPRVSGSPHYMAPEQILDKPFDGRLDIYALGCMAYEMLAGCPPFKGTAFGVLEAHVTEPPPPLTKLSTSLPPIVDPVFLRCLEKDPDARWADVHELEAALLELQIALGFTTPWDDLPMPLVDEARRQQLLAAMPRAKRRAPRITLAGLASVLVMSMAPGALIAERGEEPAVAQRASASEPELARIESSINQVRLAASKACWVYPNADEPQQPTALHLIRVLESEQGPLAERAREQAGLLRSEIAATLVRLGDRYWAAEHGQSFALEFYALALMFRNNLDLPADRVALSPVQLAEQLDRIERGQFSAAELTTARVLATLVDEDVEHRRQRIDTLLEAEDRVLPLYLGEQLAQLAAAESKSVTVSAPVAEQTRPDDETTSEPERRPAQAAALVKQARAATARGDRHGARRAFTLALEHDDRSIDALIGLAELRFEAGEYSEALPSARRASRLRPNDGELLILLGDCYLKTLRKSEARDTYARAEKLGHPKAAARLAKLD
jgi:tetratricopeptide (TPR) repeat protein